MNFKKILPSLLLLIILFIPLLDLFKPGLPLTHDGQDHVARIANFYQSLQDGVFVPRWAENLNWGYGHPILMFLYPMSSYSSSFFHLLGFSFVDSLKIVFGLSFVLSGLFMYLWAKNYLGIIPGFFAAILYAFSPYRFVDLYVRGAIGEHVAFVFLPLVLYFLLKLSKKYSFFNFAGASLSLAFLILSHNAISLMFLPIIFVYAVILYRQSKFNRSFFVNLLSSIILGFSLSAFFWVPAFIEGKYTLRNIVTAGEYLKRFADFNSLLFGQWNYGNSGSFTVQLGIINILFILLSPFTAFILLKGKDKRLRFFLFLLIYLLLIVFMMFSQSNFIWERLIILQNFQFPWRFLSASVFLTSAIAGFFILILPNKIKFLSVALLTVLVLFLNKDYWHTKSYLNLPESFYTGIYNGTTDTGESAPIWSVRFMEKKPEGKIEIIEGEGTIKDIKRNSIEHVYSVSSDEKIRVRENTLYFPGWNVYVNGKSVPIEFQDQKNRGLITFFVDKGQHNLVVSFKDTKVRTTSNIISILSVFILTGFLFLNKQKRYN